MQLQKSQKWRYLSASEFEDEDLKCFHNFLDPTEGTNLLGNNLQNPWQKRAKKNMKRSERQVDILVLVTWVDLVLQKL